MPSKSEMDRQHHELISKLNALNSAVRRNEPRGVIHRIIDDVIAFTRAHFEAEEQLMACSGYPHYETHKEKHRELIEDVLRFKKKLDEIGESRFVDWFNHWPFSRVLAHIQYADSQIGSHVYLQDLDTRHPAASPHEALDARPNHKDIASGGETAIIFRSEQRRDAGTRARKQELT
jgi:hemerythrin